MESNSTELYIKYMESVKENEGFRYAINIERPAGKVDAIVQWCTLNFDDNWRWQICRSSSATFPGNYTFFFNNNVDYMAFVLKYG